MLPASCRQRQAGSLRSPDCRSVPRPATAATASLIFYRAAVWARVGVRNGFAIHRFIERYFHVVSRARNVSWIRRGFAIDRAFVNDFALGIDDEHVRGVARVVSAAGF